jgi:hypothetical protein
VHIQPINCIGYDRAWQVPAMPSIFQQHNLKSIQRGPNRSADWFVTEYVIPSIIK